MVAASSSERSRAEAERQLSAAAERHREVLASMLQLGRPEAGQHVAVKAVGRGVQLVSFALKRAAEVGVPFERLVELTEWEPDLVREGLERAVPEPWVRGAVGAVRRRRRRGRAGRGRLRRARACRTSRSVCSPTSTARQARRRHRRPLI
jgi:hypothetical protein